MEGSGCCVVALGPGPLPCRGRHLQYGTVARLPREPRCSTRATWSRSLFAPVTQSADTTTCRDACRQTCLQVCHCQLRQTAICPRAEHIWCVQRACSELHYQNRDFFCCLLTLHNGSEKKFNPVYVGYFVCLPRPEQNEKALDWIFGGPNIILPPWAAQVLLLCKIEWRQLSPLHVFMAPCSEWLAVRVCPLSAVVVWSQSLYTFHCQAPLYQGSPNWVISRCLYRAAQYHMHTLHSLPVSFWQYIIYSFRLLLFFQDQQPYWFGSGGCRYRFTQQFEFTWLNDTPKVYVGYSVLLSHRHADSSQLS